ncbi:hypothetical protein NLU13_9449 [Sarocladium strictum]|uniref:Uncharacterized protein n=1 Tax=Sarocladium strictum TaxID=5046 RepID=A0AA39L472_SARSR|nr:hypothetical protein NLU13_9449 [Sarocladium strictum]
MGGKTWSFEEERFFWREIVPLSPKGANPLDRTLDWDMCARRMQHAMGPQARRKYTKLMLFEHYFQNVSTGHMSPHALAFVNEHKRQLAAELQPPKEKTEEPTKKNDAVIQNIETTVKVPKALVAADVGDVTTAWGLPSARDNRQLPRLDIPAYQPHHANLSPTGSTPGSYDSSPITEFPTFWPCPPQLMLQSHAHIHGYPPPSTFPMYGLGRAPIAPMSNTESSPTSQIGPVPSTPPLLGFNVSQVPHTNRRKIGDTMPSNVYPSVPKRRLIAPRAHPLDTLATAASLDYAAGSFHNSMDHTANISAAMAATNTACYGPSFDTSSGAGGTGSVVAISQPQDQIQDGGSQGDSPN